MVGSNRLVLSSFYLVGSSIINAIGGFVFWIFVANWYSPNNVGLASSIVSITIWIGIVSTLGLGEAFHRYLPSSKQPRTQLINSGLIIVFLFSVILSIISSILLFPNYTNITLLEFFFFSSQFVLLVISFSCFRMINSIFTGFSKSKLVFQLSILVNILRFALVPILSIFTFHSIIVPYALAFFLSFLLGFFFLLPRSIKEYKLSITLNSKDLLGIWRFSLASFVARIINGLPSAFLPFLVLFFISEEASAYFFIPWMIFGTFVVGTRAVGTSFLVEGASSPNNYHSSFRIAFILVEIAAFVFLAIIFLQGSFILNLFGSNYSSISLSLLKILAISSFFVGFNSLYYEILRLDDRLFFAVLSQAIVALGIIIWSMLFLPIFGLKAIGDGWLFLNIIMTGIILIEFILSKLFIKMRLRNPIEKISNNI